MDGWKYEEVDNNIYLNDMFCTVYPLGNQTYSSTFYPQVIYVPSKIDNKDIYSIDDNFFMNIVDRFDINAKRFFVSPGIKSIGKNVFSINYNMYSNVSDSSDNIVGIRNGNVNTVSNNNLNVNSNSVVNNQNNNIYGNIPNNNINSDVYNNQNGNINNNMF